MIENEPTRLIVDLTDLQYIYWTLHLSVKNSASDVDTMLALENSQQAAFQILERILNVGTSLSGVPVPVLGGPSVDRDTPNPLLPAHPRGGGQVNLPVTAVVYGIAERFESFAFLDDREAATRVAEVGSIQSCTTLGDLRELVPTLVYAYSPLDPADDKYPYLPDNHPVDLTAFESWPLMAVQYALDDLPGPVIRDLIDEAGAEEIATMLDGDYLHVPLDRETDVLAVLARHGLRARRDDLLIAGLE
jgi:hypothetical protein